MNECKPLAPGTIEAQLAADPGLHVDPKRYSLMTVGRRGLHSFPIQLNLSSSDHRITRLSSKTCPGVAQVEL